MTMWNRRRVKPRAPTRAAGFTLLEVLVAVAIVALALVTFMGLHLRSLDATIRAQDLTTAVLLAQGKMATMGEFPETGEEQRHGEQHTHSNPAGESGQSSHGGIRCHHAVQVAVVAEPARP